MIAPIYRAGTSSESSFRVVERNHPERIFCRFGDRLRQMFLAFAADCVAAAIPHFISLEMGNLVEAFSRLGPVANVGHRAFVAVVRMKAIIHMALEVVRAVKPLARANEDAAVKPFRAVVAVGRAGIRSVVVIPVGAYRGGSQVYANADLSVCFGSAYRETDCSDTNY